MARITGPVWWLLTWPADSQQVARRNAMIACTSLTQRRREHQEVHDFLASFYGPSYATFRYSKEA